MTTNGERKEVKESVKNLSIYEKLCRIQVEMKAPKGQYNSFGKYAYRSAEDILEAVKPFLAKYRLALTIHDEIKLIGDRFYIVATAKLSDFLGKDIEVTGWAREELQRKGMDGSQLTGSTSSYARKYALNGLFAIDDTKDADTNQYQQQGQNRNYQQQARQQGQNYSQQNYQQGQNYNQSRQQNQQNNNQVTEKQQGYYFSLIKQLGWQEDERKAHLQGLGFNSFSEVTRQDFNKVVNDLKSYLG